MNSGIAIILNGASASGKTTIQKRLQEAFDIPFMSMGIDSMLVGMLPSRYFNGSATNSHEVLWCEQCVDASGEFVSTLHFGEAGRCAISGIHQAIGAFVRSGNNAVVDYILYEENWLPELVMAVHGLRAYFVGIVAPLEVLERREKDRGTSPVGHARSHYQTIHAQCIYDLELDSSVNSPEECAALIRDYVLSGREPVALRNLGERFGW